MTDDIGPKALGLPKVVSEPTSAPTLLSLKSGPKSPEGVLKSRVSVSQFLFAMLSQFVLSRSLKKIKVLVGQTIVVSL